MIYLPFDSIMRKSSTPRNCAQGAKSAPKEPKQDRPKNIVQSQHRFFSQHGVGLPLPNQNMLQSFFQTCALSYLLYSNTSLAFHIHSKFRRQYHRHWESRKVLSECSVCLFQTQVLTFRHQRVHHVKRS
jgi:hypothetical protein